MMFYDTTRPAPCQPASLDWRADPERCRFSEFAPARRQRPAKPEWDDVWSGNAEDIFGGDVDEFDIPF